MTSDLWRDLRLGLRALARRPGFALTVAATLAFGVGINATVLGMADALLLRPFPFRDYPRLAVLFEVERGASERGPATPADFLDWRRQAESFEGLVAWEWWNATLSGDDGPERLQAFRVTPGFFELLGAEPSQGRAFVPGDERLGEHRQVVIGDGLWRRRFGADPGLLGSEVRLDGEPYAVVGIAPPRFAFPVGAELWSPLALAPQRSEDRSQRSVTVLGRLAAGTSLRDAQAELDLIAGRLARQHPDTNLDRLVTVLPISSAFRDASAVPLVALLQAAALLVLLVACTNVTGLLLGRAVERRRELAVRSAIGASRGRLVREVIGETAVLGAAAALGSTALAWAGLRLLRSSVPPDVARYVEGWNGLGLSAGLAALVPALALGVTLVLGLVQAAGVARAASHDALSDGARGTNGVDRQRFRQGLVVAQVATALALLIAAGLAVAGGVRLVSRPGGFDPERLLRVELPLPDDRYGDPASRRELAAALLERLASGPAVEGAALASVLPASGWNPSAPVRVEDTEPREAGLRPRVGYRAVSPGYLDLMRISLIGGRRFSDADREDAQPVAIVSAAAVARLWPDQDPLGRRLRLDEAGDAWRTVVGVVGDVSMYNWWDGEDPAAVYVPWRQAPPHGLAQAVVRTRGEPAAAAAGLRAAVRAVDPLLPVQQVRTMREAIDEAGLGLTHLASLMGACGGLALLLAVLGVHGLMTYSVSQRTHELAVRQALGATTGDVLRLVMRQAGLLTALGLGIGVLLALVLARAMESAFLGVVAVDSRTVAGVTVALGATALSAALLPLRRVVQLDPARVLRSE